MSLIDPLRLGGIEVVIRVDPAAEPAVLWAAAALASMCTRTLGPVTVPSVALPVPNPWGARTLPAVPVLGRLGPRGRGVLMRRVTVGEVSHAPDADVYVGGDDWTAVVSRRAPVAAGPCRFGGLGLHAAVALAFGELLKDVLVDGPGVRIDGELHWNLLDGRVGTGPLHLAGADVASGAERAAVQRHPSGHAPGRPAVPPVAFLGAGSVGSSAAALLSLTGLAGTAEVVDPDDFDPRRNAYRCPGVPAAEAGGKAAWAARMLRQAGWEATAHRATVGEWARNRGSPGYPGVALVSVDNVDGRREAAEVLAATTVSAGVAGLAFHVQRHLPADDFACPYCDLVDAGGWRGRGRTYARFGLTAPRLQALLDGETLSVEDVATAIWAGSVDADAMGSLVGRRLVDLLARGGVAAAEVSAPHVSWLAGTLMAAEVVKAATGLPGLDRRVDVDLAGVPLGGWRRPRRNPSGRCPCSNPARRSLARTLYGP